MVQPSTALRVMLSPSDEYRALLAAGEEGSWTRALAGLARTAALLGVVTSIAATRRVTVLLVASQLLCWSFVPLLQFVNGALVIRGAGRRVGFARSVELLFAAHAPWSLWLVAVAGLHTVTSSTIPYMLTAVVPAVWTARLVRVFCVEILGLSRAHARARALTHQLVTWLMILVYVELMGQLLIRLGTGVEP